MEKEMFREIAERLGWNATIDDDGKFCEISRFSPKGQDVYFSIDVGDEDNIWDNVQDLYEGYDPGEETYLWLGPDGHGKNGAPYDMKDLLEDMKWVEKELEKLYNATTKENSNEGLF